MMGQCVPAGHQLSRKHTEKANYLSEEYRTVTKRNTAIKKEPTASWEHGAVRAKCVQTRSLPAKKVGKANGSVRRALTSPSSLIAEGRGEVPTSSGRPVKCDEGANPNELPDPFVLQAVRIGHLLAKDPVLDDARGLLVKDVASHQTQKPVVD
ncbi:hypothetical protein T265_02416 [Opisthorchis viverrini]|uniref:Uncharacterized protein n=1 Tax=Opisthorchis viverrini TaxID=6198 RepID=A0A075A6U6_OPIVI|nr:hypothetical protein T265_02416 [Opisthorchis viverrini]KER31370.1 hypothetical protein T265_02416 [Opisthorchis viverrini]